MAKSSSIAHKLYTGELGYDFVGKKKLWYTFSGVVLLICILAIALRGLNLSIDFKGGTEFTVPTQVTAQTVSEYSDAALAVGLPDMSDVTVNTIGDNQVRIQTRSLNAEEVGKMRQALAAKAGIEGDKVTNSLIGASWGKQITQQGLTAFIVFLALVSLMIWAYFRELKMSVAAIAALMHDMVVTLGVFALVGFSFSPASLIGLLTILGYSLYDTVVVFDKVRENTKDINRQRRTYSEAASMSVNQVLVRSINTTVIGVLPVAALLVAGAWILGTGPLKDLGLALFVGMIAGAYSSIFIATPLLAQMKEAEPAMKEHRAAVERRRARHGNADTIAADKVSSAVTPRTPAAKAAPMTAEPVEEASAPSVALISADEFRQRRQQPSHKARAERKNK